jgi:DNA-binding transcriptional regulator YiaG
MVETGRDEMNKEVIKKIRKSTNLSQEDFAHLIGVTTKTVSRWESGESKPTKLTLKILTAIKSRKNKEITSIEVVIK